MKRPKIAHLIVGLVLALAFPFSSTGAETTLLNASYEVSREFYEAYNPVFTKFWQEKGNARVRINQSHAGSSKQARAVIDGLAAEVVTMNNVANIDAVVEKGGRLIGKDWRSRFPNHSSPYKSAMIFLVRKGKPKSIKDWGDLLRPGVTVVVLNQKTAGNGRYSFLAAWAFALARQNGNQAKAQEFVAGVFKNVPVLDSGGRGATTTFVQRGIGDVLLTFEAEVLQAIQELGRDRFEAVVPSLSIEAEFPVAMVDQVAAKHKTTMVARAYLDYLYSPAAQELLVQHFYRPSLASVAEKYADRFGKLKLVSIDEVFGSARAAQKTHFADGGTFDQIYQKKK